MKPCGISILGSTGSIGTQTLDVVRSLGNGHRVLGLSARSKWEALGSQVREFSPAVAALAEPEPAARLAKSLPAGDCAVLSGEEGLIRVATIPEVRVVVSSIVGAAGLAATLAAVDQGKRVAVANKESLVVAGTLLMKRARAAGAEIVPIDSEHSAIFQSLRSGRPEEVEKLILTASGGPFRQLPAERFGGIRVADALKHPNWQMGPKITVDSATLMNKALEVIEAKHLFGIDPDRIEVVIHPQSIVHSCVQFRDGSVVAQMGLPDMRIPIQYALTHPARVAGSAPRLDLTRQPPLAFERPDLARFPALALGYRAARIGGTMEAVLSAANEIAVERFLAGAIPFTAIPEVVEAVMDAHQADPDPDLARILAADRWARQEAGRVAGDPKLSRSAT